MKENAATVLGEVCKRVEEVVCVEEWSHCCLVKFQKDRRSSELKYEPLLPSEISKKIGEVVS